MNYFEKEYILRTKYDIIINPKPYKKIIVVTWPHEKRNVLTKVTYKWVIINNLTRKLSFTKDINYTFIPKKLSRTIQKIKNNSRCLIIY